MCGIAGQIHFNGKRAVESDVRSMLAQIVHRGPDDSGVYLDREVGLGHQRLSIIDLSKNGHQPMTDMTGRYHIVFNGEMYNFKIVRAELEKEGIEFRSNTDTEVIVNLYARQGKECVQKIHGMFALAIWDSETRELFIARDRLGKKPLKYYLDDSVFLFASELKSILATSLVDKEIDWLAIDQFLTHRYVPAPHTGFKNIYKLPPASFAVIRDGEIDIQSYWDIDYSKKLKLSEADWITRIEDALRKAIKERLFADVPLGVHLSGGVDSSLIVALATEESDTKIDTYSIGFQEKEHDELEYARLVADRYKTNHHERIVTASMKDRIPELVVQYEEPYADPSALPTWVLSQETRKDITVVLNGDGGDENFAGYERNLVAVLHPILRMVPGKKFLSTCIKKTGIRNKNISNLKRLFDTYDSDIYQFYENVVAQISSSLKESLYSNELKVVTSTGKLDTVRGVYDKHAGGTSLDRFLYTGIKTFLPDDLLVKVDIATMNHSIEARSPFLDHAFLELTAQLPGTLKINGLSKKYILKKIAEKYIPRECIYRPKQGFTVPISDWMRGDMNRMLRDNVLDEKFIEYGFDRETLTLLIEQHEKNEVDNSKQLWTLLMLRLWLKQWFEK